MKLNYLTMAAGYGLVLGLAACQPTAPVKAPTDAGVSQPVTTASAEQPKPAQALPGGDYVDDGYARRGEGYDWVAVSVRPAGQDRLQVQVHARADKKRQTCRLSGQAQRSADGTWVLNTPQVPVVLRFLADRVSISAPTEEQRMQLNYFCNGGASLAGDYQKLPQPMTPAPVFYDYEQTLSLQNVGFEVQGQPNRLLVTPYGLKADNRPLQETIDGRVVSAEVEDMNRDGWPELLVFVRNEQGRNSVVGYSVNGGRSVSSVAMPVAANQPQYEQGRSGPDEFAQAEGVLVQRFALQNGKTRQIQYKLKDGEAMRHFVVDRVLEY